MADLAPITIIVSPEPRHPVRPPRVARFVATVDADQGRAGRVLGAFSDPLCSSLSEGLQPDTPLLLRHAGSDTVALRSTVGVAAGLRVSEETSDGKPRFTKWVPFERSRLGAEAA
jgi:hypothetical protein